MKMFLIAIISFVSIVMIVSTMIASGHMLGHLIDKDTAKYEKENRK